MRGRAIITSLAILVAALGGWVLLWPPSGAVFASSDGFDIDQGAGLYQENCAACHGDKLQGQPNWRSMGEDGVLPAPPHDETGHTWHHDDGLLFLYTKLGGKQTMAQKGVEFNSGMPGFGDQLSDQQIWNILAYIKSTWPDRQRQVQAARSEAQSPQKDANQ